MAKRGRPKKNVDVENKTSEKIEITPEENTIEEVTPEKVEEEVAPEKSEPVQPFGSYEDLVRNNPPDSDVVGEGTLPDYNPFSQSVVEREYSTPEIASGVIEDIKEPQFIPPSYDDLVNSNAEEQAEQDGVNDSPFDNPNPAINDLDGKDKKVACESLVDTFLDGYEQLHRYAQHIVKVDEDELLQRHQAGKIDLYEKIPLDENGKEISVKEFVQQYNEQGQEALQYDKEFGFKVKPAMIRVFMKKGWGMTDEQFLMYMFGRDIAVKVGIMYQLKNTINSTLETLEKEHKKSKRQGGTTTPEPPVYETENYEEEEDDGYDDDEGYDDDDGYEDVEEVPNDTPPKDDGLLKPLTEEEDFEDLTESYNKGLHINMPDKKSKTILPKEVR
tara:strand:+ start:2422 stop:3582 length:1161 start_codon:yes stop_codon:yes gene_type:complete